MAVIGTNLKTLLDWSREVGADGNISPVIEALSQENEILDDMLWQEGNLPTGERVIVRTGLPQTYWRKLNMGIPSSKATSVPVDEAAGMLEARSHIDKDLMELNGNSSQFRANETAAFLESMSQEFARALFYANSNVNPEMPMGLASRFPTLATNANGPLTRANVINAGGTGTNNTSIYLIGWGPRSVYGFFPKGSRAGLVREDLGIQDAFDASNNRFRAYMEHFQWKCGVAVADWRYVVRIANIDVTQLTKNAASGADLIDLMTQALTTIHSLTGVRPVFYANRTVLGVLRRQAVNKVSAGTLRIDEIAGKRVVMFGEAPVRQTDAILNTEAALV